MFLNKKIGKNQILSSRRGALSLCFIIALLTLFSSAAFAQHGGDFAPRTIRFAKGATVSVQKGVTYNDKGFAYELRARAGQTMSVRITGRGVDFLINQESGEALTDQVKNWSGELPATGKFWIFVSSSNGSDRTKRPFTLQITIR